MSRARVVFNQVLSNSVDEAQFGLVFGLQDAAKIADTEQLQQTLKTLAERELVGLRHEPVAALGPQSGLWSAA